jgi:flagella basal body P-ring formation protein FlgA
LALGYLQRTNIVPTPAVASSGTLVAVAARDLAMGTVLDPADVEIVDWPTSAVPVGYARSADEVVGRGLRRGDRRGGVRLAGHPGRCPGDAQPQRPG